MLDNVNQVNLNQVIKDINAKENQVQLAAVKALNKTALWLKSQAAREISKEKQITLKMMRRRLKVIKANRSRLTAIVKASLYDVKAYLLGNMKQTKKGSRAGKHQFMGAFVATMPRKHRGIFKREGRSALPIEEVKLSLEPESSRIIKGLLDYEAERVFEKFFYRELNYLI